MRCLLTLLITAIATTPAMQAQSTLLESVKKNPEEALALCRDFRALNAKGISANSTQTLEKISLQKNLNLVDAEILSIYIIGLNCPDVR